MTVQHHLDIATLMSCSAGSQPEALAGVIASHLAVCPRCCEQLRKLSCVGDVLLATLPPVAVAQSVPKPPALDSERRSQPSVGSSGALSESERVLDATMQSVLANRGSRLEWHDLAPGVRAAAIQLSPTARGHLSLVALTPGSKLPDQTHASARLTFVVEGNYHDERGTFGPGDVADFDDRAILPLVAGADTGCLCLIASDRP